MKMKEVLSTENISLLHFPSSSASVEYSIQVSYHQALQLDRCVILSCDMSIGMVEVVHFIVHQEKIK